MIRTVRATRYVTPLREGGSLPAIIEGDDDGTYVLKFRGAGQGAKALVAELVAGEIARVLGLPVPEIVFVELDPVLGQTEPDSEIKALIETSAGLNLALDYLPGSITFDPLVPGAIEGQTRLASQIVWFDALTTNVDRTARNTNLLVWHKALWLIDHGASLYFHHAWDDFLERATSRFPQIKGHVLLPWAREIADVDEELAALLSPPAIAQILELIPAAWLGDVEQFASVEEHRAAYAAYFSRRLEGARGWVDEAVKASKEAIHVRR